MRLLIIFAGLGMMLLGAVPCGVAVLWVMGHLMDPIPPSTPGWVYIGLLAGGGVMLTGIFTFIYGMMRSR